ncbi:uncharacterized protein TNCV_4947541 [Trichonephila clavipes]|nr:uncharacterized protein TNCV_4947541 [Trichonephila clavipes]
MSGNSYLELFLSSSGTSKDCPRSEAHAGLEVWKVDASYTRAFGDGHVILNHGQVSWTTPELAPPLLTSTPHQREDVSALDIFNVHRCSTRRVFNGTGIELVTRHATIRYLYHLATAATSVFLILIMDF